MQYRQRQTLTKRQRTAITIKHTRLANLLLPLCATVGACLPVATAHAAQGDYQQVLCRDSQTGQPTGNKDGITKQGLTTWIVQDDCANANSTTGIRFFPGYGGTVADNTWAAMLYRPPTDIQFKGGTIYRSMVVNPVDGWGLLIFGSHQGTNIAYGFELPRFEAAGERSYGNFNRGTTGVAFASGNAVGVSGSQNGFTVTLQCNIWGTGYAGCPIQNNHFDYRLYGARLTLHDGNYPQLSGNVSGSLADSAVLKGTEDLTINATDKGSGLYFATLYVNNQAVSTASFDDNNGRCMPFAGQERTYSTQVPCKLNVGQTLSFSTSTVPDGDDYRIRVAIRDAAGNETTVLNRAHVKIQNGSEGNGPPERTGNKQSLCVLDKSKCSNGDNAGSNATLTADWQQPSRKSKKERKYIKVAGDRATTIFGMRTVVRGKLVNKDNGQPIGNAKVRLYQTPTRPGLFQEDVGGIRTQDNGNFTMIIPRAMPSRKLRFEYRPIEDEEFVAAARELSLGVKAAVSLRLSRKTVRPGQRVSFKGRLSGKPYPKAGKQIVILGRSKGERRWKTVGVARTKSNGTYRLSYKFKNRSGRVVFEFKALSKFEEAYPYEAGQSSVKRLTRL